MSLNETLKKRRKELSLTQSGIAQALGVSTPAVSKWEKGTAFPEISLLPPLARLLKIDLNTLFSFDKELTSRELDDFLEELHETMRDRGFEEAFRKTQKKINEYPQNIFLISTVIPYLDSKLQTESVPNREYYEGEFEDYYKKLIACEEIGIREIGFSMYILNLLRRENYLKAEKVIDDIPEINLDKSQFKEQLYFRKGEINKASQIARTRVLSNIIKTQQSLLELLDIAIISGNESEVQRITRIYQENIENFNLPRNNEFFLDLRLALARKDQHACTDILNSCLDYIKNCNSLSDVLELDLSQADLRRQFNLIQNYILNIDKINFIKENKVFEDLLVQIKEELTRFI